MPESLAILETGTKPEKYINLLPQIKALISGETNLYANLANVSAALNEAFKFWWVGFYLVDIEHEDQLVLGPFQGPIACTRIKKGRGVCGSSWQNKETLIVPDVDKFPGHIACSSLSKSEIVVPLYHPVDRTKVLGVLDVDSEVYDCFDETDAKYLNELCEFISENVKV